MTPSPRGPGEEVERKWWTWDSHPGSPWSYPYAVWPPHLSYHMSSQDETWFVWHNWVPRAAVYRGAERVQVECVFCCLALPSRETAGASLEGSRGSLSRWVEVPLLEGDWA